MKSVTQEEFQWFTDGELWAKVLSKEEGAFYNKSFPVISIGFDWVTCDVLKYDGTDSFDVEEVKLFRKTGNCNCKKPTTYWKVKPGISLCEKCGLKVNK